MQVHAALIVVLTRGGSTARLVAKYRPSIPVLTVAVPVLTTDALTWTCSGEAPARQCLMTRGLLPLLAEGSARATDTDTTDEILAVRLQQATARGSRSGVLSCCVQPVFAGLQWQAAQALHVFRIYMYCAYCDKHACGVWVVSSCVCACVQSSIEYAKQQKFLVRGDCIVALHRIGNASVIKIVDIK